MDTDLIDAGDFGAWLLDVRAAIDSGGESDVPCGPCTGCCTSSQFVHVGPDERDALAHIPADLLFPAPRMPAGHRLMGYDERGHCPMLIDGACSIYEHRPRACRVYDCRVLAAAGLTLDDEPTKASIAERVRRWRFSYSSQADRGAQEAIASRALALPSDAPATARSVEAVTKAVL